MVIGNFLHKSLTDTSLESFTCCYLFIYLFEKPYLYISDLLQSKQKLANLYY